MVEILAPFMTSWDYAGSVTDFVEKWLSVENAPNQAVLSIVADIRRSGLPCFVASTQEHRRAAYLATEMRFEQQFDGLFFSCDIGVAKPNENFFRTVADRLGQPGHELLLFDDSIPNVEGARATGWLAEQFTSLQELRTDVARHTGLALDAS